MRRNPEFTKDFFRQFLGAWKGGNSAIARMSKADPAFFDKAFAVASAVIAQARAKQEAEQKAAEAEAEAAKVRAAAEGAASAPSSRGGDTGPLTDRQAWNMLADLVDEALPDLTADERAALKAAFREEAAKASG